MTIYAPDYVEYEEGQTIEDYPYLHESQDEWVVDTTVQLPPEYVPDAEAKTTYVDGVPVTTVFEVEKTEDGATGAAVGVASGGFAAADAQFTVQEVKKGSLRDCMQLGKKRAIKRCLKRNSIKKVELEHGKKALKAKLKQIRKGRRDRITGFAGLGDDTGKTVTGVILLVIFAALVGLLVWMRKKHA